MSKQRHQTRGSRTSVARPDTARPLSPDTATQPLVPFGAAMDHPTGQRHIVDQLRLLQGNLGNSSVLRQIQRDPPDTATADPSVSTAAIPADLQAFRDHGPFPGTAEGQLIVPDTGLGGFNASYDPATMELTITVNMLMTFLDGISISGGVFLANNPGLQDLVDALNATTGERRVRAEAAVRDGWQWHGDEDAWMAQYQQQVAAAWSGRHVFQGSRPGWEEQLAHTRVQINAAKIVSSGGPEPVPEGAGAGPVHTRATIFKTSPVDRARDALTPIADDLDENVHFFGGHDEDVGAEVNPGSTGSGTDQTLTLGSDQLATPVSKLTHPVFFGFDRHDLSPDAVAGLTALIRTIQAPAGQPGTSIEVVGHASTVGDEAYNQALSERRANAVANFLQTTSVDGAPLANVTTRLAEPAGSGETGMDASARSQRVDVIVAGGEAQNVAAHEFGHMIGLGDEYAVPRDAAGNPNGLVRGTGGQVGDSAIHDRLSQDMGLGGAVAENNESVMSLGDTIRPQHYATFMKALRDLTGVNDWRLRS